MNNYVYEIDHSLYINLTNRCTNSCTFCIRNTPEGIAGYDLWLEKEPDAAEVLMAIKNVAQYREVVFCGYGEPMLRMNQIVQISRELKKHPVKIRINTNGQANLFYGQNVVPRLEGLIDTISISLNAAHAADYQKVCQSVFGEPAFDAIIEFAKECKKVIPLVILSVVDVISQEDIAICEEIARSIGVKLRIRAQIGDAR